MHKYLKEILFDQPTSLRLMNAWAICVSALNSVSFLQIITKYIYGLLEKECHLKKVTLPVSQFFFNVAICSILHIVHTDKSPCSEEFAAGWWTQIIPAVLWAQRRCWLGTINACSMCIHRQRNMLANVSICFLMYLIYLGVR